MCLRNDVDMMDPKIRKMRERKNSKFCPEQTGCEKAF